MADRKKYDIVHNRHPFICICTHLYLYMEIYIFLLALLLRGEQSDEEIKV